MMTPVQIFLLGWYEHEKRRQAVQLLSPFGDLNNASLTPPTEAEIKQKLAESEPLPEGPPYDQSQMKEYSIG